LETIQAQCVEPLKILVVFTQPAGVVAADWRDTDVVRIASRLPDVEVRWDDGGVTAALFQAHTSGYAALYDARGRLLFSGGITSSRGHEGDNAGRQAILSRAAGEADFPATTPVYGCPLYRSSHSQPCDAKSCPPPA
jgi:hypothetical protein